jgi:predicted nucleotide-binding protein
VPISVHRHAVRDLAKYLREAEEFTNDVQVDRWAKRVHAFLRQAVDPDEADRFSRVGSSWANRWDEFFAKKGYLEGAIAKSEDRVAAEKEPATEQRNIPPPTRKVFVVHGHDGEVKEAVARFIERLELDPIILHEQPNQGRTIIEKFEQSSEDVAFAVVLLTPDDVGRAADETSELRPRARQNVILELGYFCGRLRRMRVCALYRSRVELPSDFQGVVYIEFDPAGAWRTKLAQEFVEAKLTINVEKLINK